MFLPKNKLYKRKKARTRRLLFLISFVFFGALTLWALGYLFSIPLFNKKPYISPLSSTLSAAGSNKASNQAEDIKAILSKNHIPFKEVLQDRVLITIILAGEEKIFFTKEKSLIDQTSSLQSILSRLTIEGKRFTKIDFRFDRPIVTYE